MSRKPAPPSASRGSAAQAPAGRGAGARDWLGSIRFSGFAAIMLGLVVLGVMVLAPTVATYVEQRQKIAALEEAVQLTREEIAQLERERDRWNDPAFITAQARERLYYVKPGEVSFLIVDDLDQAEVPPDPEPVSPEVEERPADWTGALLRSIVGAGTAEAAMELEIGVPDEPEPTPTPAP